MDDESHPESAEPPYNSLERLKQAGIIGEFTRAVGDSGEVRWTPAFHALLMAGRHPFQEPSFLRAFATGDPAEVRRWVETEAAGLDSPASSAGEATVPPDLDWPAFRPRPADFLALLAFPVDDVTEEVRRRALKDLVEMGVLRDWSIDDRTGVATFELGDAYRRLVEADRDPDLEPGFDAAWDAGGPTAVREWLNAEADALQR